MNKHTLIDNYTVMMGALLMGRRKFFSQSVTSPGFGELLAKTTVDLPAFTEAGIYEAAAQTPVGPLDPAFNVAQWRGAAYPTLIYHHGNNERPFDFGRFSKNTFKTVILNHREKFPANLIALRAPYHTSLSIYMEKVTELANFAAMLAVSVKLIEALQARLRQQHGSHITVSGVSLGGWVTNMHRAYFNTADRYAPMLAGAALDEVFLSSAYRRMTGQMAHDNPDAVRQTLNFEADYARVTTPNVSPLMARYDPIIVYERQQRSYGATPITVIDKGHTTAVLDADHLADFLAACLPPMPVD